MKFSIGLFAIFAVFLTVNAQFGDLGDIAGFGQERPFSTGFQDSPLFQVLDGRRGHTEPDLAASHMHWSRLNDGQPSIFDGGRINPLAAVEGRPPQSLFGVDRDMFGNTRPVIGRDGLVPTNGARQPEPDFINRPPISQQTALRRQPNADPFSAASLQRQPMQQQVPRRQPMQQQVPRRQPMQQQVPRRQPMQQQQVQRRQPTQQEQQEAQQRLQQHLQRRQRQQQQPQLRTPSRAIDWNTRGSFAIPQQ